MNSLLINRGVCFQPQEVFLTSRVTHVVRDRAGGAGGAWACGSARWRREGRARADAMLERVRQDPPHISPNNKYIQLTVQKVYPAHPSPHTQHAYTP